MACYSDEQAKRGEPLYAQHCSSCHGPDLAGGEMAPGLVGGDFAANWNDLTLGQLFDRIRTSMPQNNPGSLSRQQNADILAFILLKGTAPAGQTELPTQSEVLNTIKYVATNPKATETVNRERRPSLPVRLLISPARAASGRADAGTVPRRSRSRSSATIRGRPAWSRPRD